MRKIAVRLCVLRASVQIATRCTFHSSNALPSSRYLASVLIGVRCASRGQPCATDLDLVGQVAAAPPLQPQIAGAADAGPVAEASLREWHGRTRLLIVEQSARCSAACRRRWVAPRSSRT